MDLVVEDGTGLEDANAYVDIDATDDFYASHLYASAWTALDDADDGEAKKTSALIMAARLIDASVEWQGSPVKSLQGLAWPRTGVVVDGNELASDAIPRGIREANMELCRWLLASDRDAAGDETAVKREKVDVIEVEYQDNSRSDLIPDIVLRMLSPFVVSAPSEGGAPSARSFSLIRG